MIVRKIKLFFKTREKILHKIIRKSILLHIGPSKVSLRNENDIHAVLPTDQERKELKVGSKQTLLFRDF